MGDKAAKNTDAAGQVTNLWTPANIVTVTRIVLVPVFVVVLLSPWPDWFPEWPTLRMLQPWIAAALFVVLAATDSLDGYLARSRNEVTTFGKFMDPLADKLLVCSAMICLISIGRLAAWIVIIIIAREFIISGFRLIAVDNGIVIAASWYGKTKTVLQIAAILLFILKNALAATLQPSGLFAAYCILAWLVMIAAVIMTIVSMLDYFKGARELFDMDNSTGSDS